MNNMVGSTPYDLYVTSIAVLNLALAVSCMAVSAAVLCVAAGWFLRALPVEAVLDRQAAQKSQPSFVNEN